MTTHSTSTNRRRHGAGLAATVALGLTLAGCGGAEEGGGLGTVTLGFIPSWTDGVSTAYLLEDRLEEVGYTVEMEEFADAGVAYTALAQGDVDMYPSAWPEVTHATYMEQYGDQLEDLGTYYDQAVLTFAVPEYTDISSIDEVADNVDRFDGRIVGIEPGSGLAEVTSESVIPAYGLEEAGYTFETSSTTAMLTELERAIGAQEDILVTLWRPFWANSEYPVKDLEDPQGALGEAEGLHFLATEGFSEEFPEVAEWVGGIQLDDDQYGSLEQTVAVDNQDDPAVGVQAWLEENPDVVAPLQVG